MIKGWKHANSDLMKHRAEASNASKPVKLVRANKDGSESKMYDAMQHFTTEEEARSKHHHLRKLNPGRDIKHHLYVNGEHKGLLGGETSQHSEFGLTDRESEELGRRGYKLRPGSSPPTYHHPLGHKVAIGGATFKHTHANGSTKSGHLSALEDHLDKVHGSQYSEQELDTPVGHVTAERAEEIVAENRFIPRR